MKITPIRIFTPYINQNVCNTPLTGNLLIKTYPYDTVSFKKLNKKERTPFIYDTRELDLHCACCGKLMLKNNTVNEFINKKIYFPANIALKKITYEQNFQIKDQPIPLQKVYNFLKREAAKNTDLNIEELINTPKVQEYIKRTNQEQLIALEEIKNRCKRVSHSSQYIINEIEKLNPDFQQTENAIFQDLKLLSKNYPSETLYNILNKPKIKEFYLQKLQKKQNSKLKKVPPLIQQLSPEFAQKASIALEESFRIFNTESTDIIHKRTRVIEKFEEAFKDIADGSPLDKEITKLIMERLENLPDSKNDVNAFMVKYSRKNPNAIPKILVERIRNTNDHVKPEHRKYDEGANNKKNYLNLCGKCNHNRKTESYLYSIKKNPDMPKNTQRQIDEIIDFINRGILAEYDSWPNDIKEPLGLESEGKIVIDTSRLDVQKAKKERTKRLQEYLESESHRPQSELTDKIYRPYEKKNRMY